MNRVHIFVLWLELSFPVCPKFSKIFYIYSFHVYTFILKLISAWIILHRG